ncbi:MAG: hypothetical protein J6Y76_00515 [Paludibacteraceae bacterium]|nr:hypothetical protein [Paludibacteraceae bacterium]
MSLQSLLIVIGLLLAAFILLSVRIIIKKNGRFRSMHISDSKAMRERGIGCVQSQDRQARQDKRTKIDVKNL